MLKFKLNVAERKTLAKRMEELTGIHPYYTKAPLYSYDIGSYTIDRNGNLLVEPENADAELLTTLLNEGLIRGGESIESTDDQMENTEPTDHLEEDPVTEDTEAETEVLDEQESEDESTTEGNEPAEAESEEASEPDNAAEDEPDAEEPESEEQSEAEDQPEEVPLDLELAFPVSQHNGVTLRNLVNLLYSRGKLIGKATGGHFHVEEGLVEKLKDDSCTFAIMNFINAAAQDTSHTAEVFHPFRESRFIFSLWRNGNIDSTQGINRHQEFGNHHFTMRTFQQTFGQMSEERVDNIGLPVQTDHNIRSFIFFDRMDNP